MTRRTRLALAGLLLAVCAFGREEYSRTFDKTVTVHTGERVYVEHRFGDVTIHTHPGTEVAIHAEIKVSAADANQAKTFADRVEIMVEPGSSELSIRTRYPEGGGNGWPGWMHNVSYLVRYDLTIPETAPLEVRNSFGAVSVTGLKANSDITSSHGPIEFHDGRGTQHLQNSFARVSVSNNAGDVGIDTSNAPVDVTGITGDLTVRDRFAGITISRVSKGVAVINSNGAVEITDSGGTGNVKNSFGAVTVRNWKGDMTVDNTNGGVNASNVEGAAQLNTTFGEVKFADIGRQLSIHATNSRISGQHVGGPLIIVNSFGPVTVSDIQNAVSVQSGNGGVSLNNIRGEANVKTSFAMVQASDIAGLLQVENSNGGVEANNTHGVQVTTSFAPVVLNGISGPIRIVNQNGAVDAASVNHGACQPILIRTSFSALRVHLPGNASYHVTARTSFGRIQTDFPLTTMGSLSNDSVTGSIGSGSCEMTLSDQNGSIEILKNGS